MLLNSRRRSLETGQNVGWVLVLLMRLETARILTFLVSFGDFCNTTVCQSQQVRCEEHAERRKPRRHSWMRAETLRYPQGNPGITPRKTKRDTGKSAMVYEQKVTECSVYCRVHCQCTLKTLSSNWNCGESSKTCHELTILRPHVGQSSLIYGLIMTSSSLRTALFLESSTLE